MEHPKAVSVFAMILLACGGGSGSSAGTTEPPGEPPGENPGTNPGGARLPFLDATFGSSGEATIDIESSMFAHASAITVRPDGKIVVAGQLGDGKTQPSRIFVALLTAEGALDTSFGGGKGYVAHDGDPEPPRIALGSDNGILVASQLLRRMRADGTLDAQAFGDNGIVNRGIRSVAYLGDGRIVGASNGEVCRLSPNGALDTTFAGTGCAALATSSVFDVLPTPDGKVLVASDGDQVLTKYDADGVLDPTFGDGGIVNGGGEGEMHGAVLAGDRVLVIGARSQKGTFLNPYVGAYLANGSVDTAFGTGGVVINAAAGGFHAGIALPDGRAIVLEQQPFSSQVQRLTATGAVDTSFGNDGYIPVASTSPLTSSPSWVASALAVTSDGKLLVAGSVQDAGTNTEVRKRHLWIARFNAGG